MKSNINILLIVVMLFKTTHCLLSAALVDIDDYNRTGFHTRDTAMVWDFNNWGDIDGWSVSDEIFNGVIGGSIWLKTGQYDIDPGQEGWRFMVWDEPLNYSLTSPCGLELDASIFKKIHISILNKSPETDGFIFWKTTDDREEIKGPVRFSLRPQSEAWQEIICHMDNSWQGIIDQIIIQPAQFFWSGELWIDRISVTEGEIKAKLPRPDLISRNVVPEVKIPGISQNGFHDAFRVLDECLVTDVPMKGFNYPFLAPGGAYGHNWWQLDGSLNVAGAKWVNQQLVENIMRGYSEVQDQNPDGRIDLWGGAPVRGQVADVSSIPRFFEAAWDVARRTSDKDLRELIYDAMKAYLGYWLSGVKGDESTGLITAVFEESFGGIDEIPGIMAPVDLNVAVAIGLYNTAKLGESLSFHDESESYLKLYKELTNSIEQNLWDNKKGAFLNFNVKTLEHYPRIICSTFDPFQLDFADREKHRILLKKLQDPTFFYWGIRPVTSISMKDTAFVEAKGTYDGRAWLGDIWTMRNVPIMNGLSRRGAHDLACELTWSTIKSFHDNYCEYVVPATGSGEGVQRYGWSASQYIQAIIEFLFGIDYDCIEKKIRIIPHIPEELKGESLSISNLQLPNSPDTRMNISVKLTDNGDTSVEIEFSDNLPDVEIEIRVPGKKKSIVEIYDGQKNIIPGILIEKDFSNYFGAIIPISKHVNLHFRFKHEPNSEKIN